MLVDIRDDLRFISAAIDANLRYAESKHASFIVFNGVATFGGFGLLRNLNLSSGSWLTQLVLSTAICLLICAIINSIYSYIPVIIQEKKASPAASAGDNALFFEHVKLHSAKSYEKLLCEQYQVDPESITPLDRCIIGQIIVNAHLASRKFALFKRTAIFDLAAIACALAGLMLTLAAQH